MWHVLGGPTETKPGGKADATLISVSTGIVHRTVTFAPFLSTLINH